MSSAPPPRDSGILLHPTSLPGSHGIGDLGDGAYRWLDFLVAGGQQLWQVMPLGPPGFGDSPYAARSAFAGNPLLISLDRLVADGLLDTRDLADQPDWPPSRVDFGAVAAFKLPRLRHASERFAGGRSAELHHAFETFIAENAGWLDDFALYMALREEHGDVPWNEWERGLVQRDPQALAAARTRLATSVERTRFIEFLFRRQWQALRRAAHARGIHIIGDIPIFVAHDSADVWAHQDLFALDADGNPTVVAGVPPDYFSPTGQRWGNPLYNWDRSTETGHRWWIERFRATLAMVDIVRIDHFRGFQAYWEVPAAEETALHGRWAPGPGEPFFRAVAEALGPLPVIVEDLGLITEDVHALRQALGYPGMTVLQFAFGDDATNPYLPHNYDRNCVVYTGTHDNDTTEGWFATLSAKEQARVIGYTGDSSESISRKLVRLALGSVARTAIMPLQDVLGLGSDARMNLPGLGTGNWNWRATADQIAPEHATWLGEMTAMYGRRQQATSNRQQ